MVVFQAIPLNYAAVQLVFHPPQVALKLFQALCLVLVLYNCQFQGLSGISELLVILEEILLESVRLILQLLDLAIELVKLLICIAHQFILVLGFLHELNSRK